LNHPTTRQKTTYNSLGREFPFSEKPINKNSSDEPPFETTSSLKRLETYYDPLGRIESLRNENRDTNNLWSLYVQEAIQYDDYGQVYSKRESNETKSGDTYHTKVQTTQNNMTYDGQGRLVRFDETSYSTQQGNSRRAWEAHAFGLMGEPSRVSESGWSDLEGSWVRESETVALDQFGRSLISHSKGRNSTSGSYDTWTSSVKEKGELGFNSLGQATYKIEFGNRHGLGSFTQITESGFADSYDSQGRLHHNKETLILEDSTRTTEINGQTYSPTNQLIGKSSTLTETWSNGESRMTDQNWKGNYDDGGRLFGFSETQSSQLFNQEGGFAGREEKSFSRESIRYNRNGQVRRYKEKQSTQIFDEPRDLIQENHQSGKRSNIEYNDESQLMAYDETGKRDGSNYDEHYQASVFNENGEAVDWEKVGTNDALGPYHLNQYNSEFDEHGRLTDFDVTGIQSGQPVKKSVRDIDYNIKGQIQTRREFGETDLGLYDKTEINEYDRFGRLQHQSESGVDTQGTYSSQTQKYV
ncbi:hypothetical protein BVX98_01730, partial [bacterium F11]